MRKYINDKDNELLAFITPKRGSEGFWEVVKAIMKHLKDHPNPMVRSDLQSLLDQVKFERSVQLNKFAATPDLSFRRLGIIPDKLYYAIERIYGHDLPVSQEQFEKGFFKLYPEFRIAERV